LANLNLFKLGVFADSAVILFELAITASLYHMFRSAGPMTATVALIARAGMITVMGLNILIWVMAYVALTSGLDVHSAQAVVQFCFEAHALGVFVWQIFFGVHLLALGWLLIREPRKPILGTELSGTIEEVGADVTNYHPGEAVIVSIAAPLNS
jgi:hypothetical protein